MYSREKKDIDREWLERRYVIDLASIKDIASEVPCSVHTIGKWLGRWEIRRGKRAIIGKPAWNSGLTKDSDPRMKKLSEDRTGSGNPRYGKEPWNKGLTAEDSESLMRVKDAMSNREVSDETREKQSKVKLGLRGENTNGWKGGLWKSGGSGYVMTRFGPGEPKLYVHRVVAEICLKRELKPYEQVHHIDMNRKNNHPENLLVIRIDEHTKLHREMSACDTLAQKEWLDENNINYIEVKCNDYGKIDKYIENKERCYIG